MRPTSTPKIEHEDNFFIELDLLSFWPTKNYCSFIGIDPTINMSGPPPATIFAGLARSSGKHDTVNYGQINTFLSISFCIKYFILTFFSISFRIKYFIRTPCKFTFTTNKNNCPIMGIDPTINMSGPPPMGAGYNFCRSCSIELQTWYGKLRSDYYCSHYYSRFNRGGPGFSCATPLLKYFTGFNL